METTKSNYGQPEKFQTKWTYQACLEVAKKYTVQSDMRKHARGALDAARRNGWLKDFVWLKDGRLLAPGKPEKWNREACFQEAQKYETKTDFLKNNESAYHRALKKGWLRDYTWFKDGVKRNAQNQTIWTYQKCFDLAHQCANAAEFAELNHKAYRAALQKGWSKDYVWFKPIRTPKWDKESCRKIALKYTVKRDFMEGEPRAYAAALRNGWMSEFDWFVNGRQKGIKREGPAVYRPAWNRKYTDKGAEALARECTTKAEFRRKDEGYYFYALRRHLMPQFTWLASEHHLYDAVNYVYRYFFAAQNAVYVGRTINPKDRDAQHHKDNGKESSVVLRFAQSNGLEIPKMEILEQGLTAEESQIQEDAYVKRYREAGMNVLNKGATGKGTGSLGATSKYTENKFLEIARRYDTLSDFIKQNRQLYDAALQYGWVQKCTFLKRKIRPTSVFTKQYCMDVAKDCRTRKELERKDSTVYGKMVKTGWIDECDWFVPKNNEGKELSYEYCMLIARQYKSIKEMKSEHSSVVSKLYSTGWIKNCTWLPVCKRKVIKLSLRGEYISTYDSLVEAAASLNIEGQHLGQSISSACRGKLPSAYGYKWRYADEPLEQPKTETPQLVQGELALS